MKKIILAPSIINSDLTILARNCNSDTAREGLFVLTIKGKEEQPAKMYSLAKIPGREMFYWVGYENSYTRFGDAKPLVDALEFGIKYGPVAYRMSGASVQTVVSELPSCVALDEILVSEIDSDFIFNKVIYARICSKIYKLCFCTSEKYVWSDLKSNMTRCGMVTLDEAFDRVFEKEKGNRAVILDSYEAISGLPAALAYLQN